MDEVTPNEMFLNVMKLYEKFLHSKLNNRKIIEIQIWGPKNAISNVQLEIYH